MQADLYRLSSDQWKFLAVFEALGHPISIDLADELVPLSPTSLFNLLDMCRNNGILAEVEKAVFRFNPESPGQVKSKIAAINTADAVSRLISMLEDRQHWEKLPAAAQTGLFVKANRTVDAALLEAENADKMMARGKFDAAWDKLVNVLNLLKNHLDCPYNDTLYVKSALDLSKMASTLGKGFEEIPPLLEPAIPITQRLGDRRSRALILLHLGFFYYHTGRRMESLKKLEEGMREVNDLGDDDIFQEASPIFGFYYLRLGKMKEAVPHYERMMRKFESGPSQDPVSPMTFLGLPYSVIYLGQFTRAIGYLDFFWRWAKRNAFHSFASTIQAVIGVALILIDKKQEARIHLEESLRIGTEHNNLYGLFLAKTGMAYYHFSEKRIEQSRAWLVKTEPEKSAGLIQQFSSPWILEMLYEFDKRQFDPIPGFNFEEQYRRIMKEANIQLKGTALRLKAKQELSRNRDPDQILDRLLQSKKYLEESGNPNELARTHVELAFISLKQGDREKATHWAHLARIGMSGYLEKSFPDSLRTLLNEQPLQSKRRAFRPSDLHQLLKSYEELISGIDIDSSLNSLVSELNRYFGAERGGLFWLKDGDSSSLFLRSFHNMSDEDIVTHEFRSRQLVIEQTMRDNCPQIVNQGKPDRPENGVRACTFICLPVSVAGKVRGVLYHDNSYLEDCFDAFDKMQLSSLSEQISNLVANMIKNHRLIDETKRQTLAISTQSEESAEQMIIAQSRKMNRILDQSDRVARSDSTILITGETGVGKELLAKRIHEISHRREEPFITIDPTTIPENLVESELFGHEKGAFTGADRQKSGWIELAHKGTLFIDEIGEIPPAIQVKLLRVIEEKTFARVGGSRTLKSDFRLIAATNRDLAAEVAGKRFRKDLYFRINIVELVLPPLRERKEDIAPIADHFLKRYARKYNRLSLNLTSPDIERLVEYPWPGNVRELQNIIERAVILSQGESIEINLPKTEGNAWFESTDHIVSLAEIQRRYIQYILEKTNGRIGGPGGAAELLGMKRTSLYTRIKTLGMKL